MCDVLIRCELFTKPIPGTDFIKFGIKNHIEKGDDCIRSVDYAVIRKYQGRCGTARVSNRGYSLALYRLVK